MIDDAMARLGLETAKRVATPAVKGEFFGEVSASEIQKRRVAGESTENRPSKIEVGQIERFDPEDDDWGFGGRR